MEVRALSFLFMNHVSSFGFSFLFGTPSIPYLFDPMIQSDDISRTAKFMSSPLVQSLASSRPVQVSTIFLVRTLFFGVCFYPILPTPTAFLFWLTQTYLQRLTNQTVTRNTLDDKPNVILEVCSHASMPS
jgi:hypothetical protein